jgi:hypothetical protein
MFGRALDMTTWSTEVPRPQIGHFIPGKSTEKHPVHTAPSTALLWLGCYWPCRHPLWFRLGLHAEARWPILWFRLGLHAEARWPIRSHDQARNLQYDSNRPVRGTCLSLAPNSLILNTPRLPPLIHARLMVSQNATVDFRDTMHASVSFSIDFNLSSLWIFRKSVKIFNGLYH